MTAVAVLPVDRLMERLGRLELQQKQLGQINHAYGVRFAMAIIQEEEAERAWLVEPPPAPAAAMQFIVASLSSRCSSSDRSA